MPQLTAEPKVRHISAGQKVYGDEGEVAAPRDLDITFGFNDNGCGEQTIADVADPLKPEAKWHGVSMDEDTAVYRGVMKVITYPDGEPQG